MATRTRVARLCARPRPGRHRLGAGSRAGRGRARRTSPPQLKELQRQRALFEHQLATFTGRLDLTLAGRRHANAADALLSLRPACPRRCSSAVPTCSRRSSSSSPRTRRSASPRRRCSRRSRSPASAARESTNLANALISESRPIWSRGPRRGHAAARLSAATAASPTPRSRASTRRRRCYQESVETAFREVADALSTVRITSSAEQDYQMSVDAARRALAPVAHALRRRLLAVPGSARRATPGQPERDRRRCATGRRCSRRPWT